MPSSRKRKVTSKRKLRVSREEALEMKALVTPRSLADLERISASYPEVFAFHLATLAGKRRKALAEDFARLGPEAWKSLSLVPKADSLLSLCGVKWLDKRVSHRNTGWGTELHEGLDQYVEIHRLIRSGLLYGAFVTARMFLERWTLNLAVSHNLSKQQHQSDQDFITETWTRLDPLVSRDIGADWAWLSEGIHGRNPLHEIGEAFQAKHHFGTSADHIRSVEKRIVQIVEAVATQLLVGIEHLARRKKLKYTLRILHLHTAVFPPTLHSNREELRLLGDITQPLDPMIVFASQTDEMIEFGAHYQNLLSQDRAQEVVTRAVIPYHLIGALAERRARSVLLARKAFINEADLMDPQEGHARLYSMLYRYSAISEAAFLVSDHCENEYEAAALRTAALALNSAWQLWLDDTDMTLGCLRGLVEQTARARTHRIKPEKAVRMEPLNPPANRWIEAAGLGRLNPIGRALGEFSHLKFTSKRQSARQLLVEIQPDDAPYPLHTARRSALENSAYLLANELSARLDAAYPRLGENFRRYVTLLDEDGHERMQHDFLEKSLRQKYRDWGEPDFIAP